jgi:SanA protein
MKLKPLFKKIFRKKTIIVFLIIIVFLSVFSFVLADRRIKSVSKNYLYSDLTKIPYNKVGLVLGTAKFLQNGQVNLYYQYRIAAAVALYQAGKISYIVVSGDNSRKTYDEPTQMKADLVLGGVPEEVIFLDYAGFRTWDSLVRIKEIFSQDHFTIISQRFHNERAVYLAHRYGLNAVAFNAKDVSKYYGFKTNFREKFARIKVFVDLLTNKKPRFLGEKIEIR